MEKPTKEQIAQNEAPDMVSFGSTDVPREEKAGMVQDLFDRVAQSYDTMNDLLSLGIHRLWKDTMVDWANPRPGQRTLDVAGGTGDIAFRIQDKTYDRADATVLDLTPGMLQVGRARARDQGFDLNIKWLAGDAMNLPLPDNSFDLYTIAFGIRNVTDISVALSEAYRVLKPGGRFLCLEFAKVDVPMLDALYDMWSFRVMPAIGQQVASNKDDYTYLVESIRRFPPQEEFAQMLRDAGFEAVRHRNLTGGIAALHSGWKI
ncbi:MAG: bifunctional demethylmenaquinone methyltransferase/2-methoxy-6-polyprenyl-1,4-benzoquinol methylase UbiE [Alphaproteobacteria bacterium]